MRNRIRFLLPVILLIGILTSVAAFAANASACDHTPGDWKVVTKPFAFLPGEKSRTCTQCGETVETAAVYNTFGLGDAGNVDKYITGVYSEVTPATLKEHFRKTGYEVTIVDANGVEPTLVSTGSKVIVGSDEYEVVVKGDVTGDGVIDIFDLLLLLGYANGEEELEGAYQKAGLISNREEADIFDLLALLDHANGGVSIEPSAPPSTETEPPVTEPPVTEAPETECTTHKYVLESNTGSCTADGVKTYACSVCGDSYTEAVTATGHNFDKGKVTTPASCGQAGVKTYTCKRSGTTETETIAAKTHIWSVATYITTPTCTTTGLKSYYCLYQCGATKTEVAAALGHDYVNNVCQREGCGKEKAIYAVDYGVRGDGVTNDGPAISRAVNAAKLAKSNLIFEPNKTYYISSSTNSDAHFDTPFTFHNAEGFTVDGQGSTFLMAPHMTYFNLWQCSDFTIKNCNFDYAVSVYLVGTVKSISGNTVVFSTDIEPYTTYYDYSSLNAFSVYKYDSGVQGYPHAFIKTMTKTASKEVTVTYSSGVGSYRVGQLVYLPNPGVGHVGGESIFMGASKGVVTLENIEIRAARNFVFHLNGNTGETFLNNVDIVPGSGNTRAIKMVSWRDGFHCKDNRGAIHWTDCENGVVFDDVMNVRNNLGYITSVTNAKTFAVVHYNNWQGGVTTPLDCKAGDVLDFYDQNNDVYYGYATVQSVTISNNTSVVTLSSTNCTVNMTQVNRSTCRVANRNTCAPGSTIADCEFSGSLRLNREITVTNTKFNLYYALWILAEGGGEGPLPGNITFRNCTFRYAYVHIDGYNRWDTGRYMPNIASYITGIRAYDCTFENGCYVQSATGCVMEKYVNGVLQIDSTSLRPSSYTTRSDYKTLTASELSAGYTFDFSANNALLFTSAPSNSYATIQRYTTLSKVNTAAAAVMREAGFGENVFFYNDSVYLHSLTGAMQVGKQYRVTMKVFDCSGNLTTLNPADSMVLLKMADGRQSEEQVNYTCTADPSNKRIVTLTFTFTVGSAYTNDFLLFYRIGNPTEFYIGSLTVAEV